MEILNIGPLELGLILILALIVLGPNGMAKSARQAAKWISKIIRSPIWKDMVSTSDEIRSITRMIVKEANLEETIQEISQFSRSSLISDMDKPAAIPIENTTEDALEETPG
jgi:sec-independent protein translocase protein TatB